MHRIFDSFYHVTVQLTDGRAVNPGGPRYLPDTVRIFGSN
jgi:hypothetical protein